MARNNNPAQMIHLSKPQRCLSAPPSLFLPCYLAWAGVLPTILPSRATTRLNDMNSMLFDWLITGQVMPFDPAPAVRGPKHVVKTGKTPVLVGAEWRKLTDSIPIGTVRDLRDRALIATLTYSFARIGAALKMKVEDLRSKVFAGRCSYTRKAASNMRCPATTHWPRRCAPISTPPASPRTGRATQFW
jgi:integrase